MPKVTKIESIQIAVGNRLPLECHENERANVNEDLANK